MIGTSNEIRNPGLRTLPPGVERYFVKGGGKILKPGLLISLLVPNIYLAFYIFYMKHNIIKMS